MTATRIIIDCDTGTDDAIAIMLAALHPAIELIACTTVGGNTDVASCTANTLAALDLVGAPDVPVYQGLSARSLPTDAETAARSAAMHGTRLPIPASERTAQAIGAVDHLAAVYGHPSDVTLVAIGPLTNIAAALARAPGMARHVPHLVIMGGGHAVANATPAAEFNIWADPEAAASVFDAGFGRLTLVTLDATHAALVSEAECARLAAAATPAGTFAASLIRQRIAAHRATQPLATDGAAPVHDALTVASLIDPGVLSLSTYNVAVECAGPLTRGRTVIDVNRRGERPPNAGVALAVDAPRFIELLQETLGRAHAPRPIVSTRASSQGTR